MKKLLVLSGKGGTGKTTVASSIIEFSKTKAFADCDVDAPNLHLIQNFENKPETKAFIGSKKATIDNKKCTFCGMCRANCRFNSIKMDKARYTINEYSCEGCGVCEFVCPQGAITLCDDVAGKTMLYNEARIFSTAQLKMGRGNSGKLVTEVKKNLFTNADLKEDNLAVIDGSPGIGCSVIASSSGIDIALIVAEPSLSGMSDMERIVKVLKGFNIKTFVCVNKADLSKEKTGEIKEWCEEQCIKYLGEIPYDKEIVKAINSGKSITEINSTAKDAIFEIYKKITLCLEGEYDS